MNDTFKKHQITSDSLADLTFQIKTIAESLEYHIDRLAPSRERAIAIARLEECVMWTVKGIYKRLDND